MIPSGLLHGLAPVSGALGFVLEILLYVGIFAAALAIVLLSERASSIGRDELLWGAAILALPLVGPMAYLLHFYRSDPA